VVGFVTLGGTMKLLILGAVAALLASCAGTYAPPVSANQTASATVAKSKTDILAAVRRVLVANGYQITAFDDGAGIVSTAPHDYKVTPDQADCGTTMGIDYLKDPRTATKVAFGVIASDGHVDVRANIEGEYRIGNSTQDITLTCVSRGTLDQDMVAKIVAAL
jgi:hypothetical protein